MIARAHFSSCLPLGLLLAAWLLALGCGGGGGVNLAAGGIRGTGGGTIVTGVIDDGALLSKARMAAADSLQVQARDVATGSLYSATVQGRGYTLIVPFGAEVEITARNGGTVLLSRTLDGDKTALPAITADINAVTHARARMALKVMEGGSALKAAHEAADFELYGRTGVPEADLKLAALVAANPTLAARVAVHQHLAGQVLSGEVAELLRLFTEAFSRTSSAKAREAFAAAANGLSSPALARTFASALEAVENSGKVGAAALAGLRAECTNTLVRTAFIEAEENPYFLASAGGTLAAAPGVTLLVTHAAASTRDILGISSTTGTLNPAPAGAYDAAGDGGRTLRFTPALADVGGTFTWTLSAQGGNGRTATDLLRIPVRALELKSGARRKIGVSSANTGSYRPLLGPVSSGSSFYLLARYSANFHRIEGYKIADFRSGEGDSAVPFTSYNLPVTIGGVRDFIIHQGVGYVATTDAGVLGYDLAGDAAAGPKYAAPSMDVHSLAVAGGRLYGLNTASSAVLRAGLDLTFPTALVGAGSPGEKAAALRAGDLAGQGGILLLASGNALAFYDTASASFLPDYNSSASFAFAADNSGLDDSALYILGSTTATRLNLAAPTWTASTLAGISWSSEGGAFAVHAGHAYVLEGNSTAAAYSLRATTQRTPAFQATPTPVFYANNGALLPLVVAESGGIEAGKSGAWLLAPGQYSAGGSIDSLVAAQDGTWYIRTTVAQPIP